MAVGINGSDAANDSEHFANLRAEMYWSLRERFMTRRIAIPDNPDLIGELTSMKYKITPKGQIQIESKDDMKKRGLESPDYADSLVLAFAPVTSFLLEFA